MGHYKDSKNALIILYHIGEQCQNLLKSFLISLLRYAQPLLRIDGTAQHFKQKYSLCVITFMDRIIEWDFSATYRSKGEKKWLVWNI